jgi:hypothetical protein
LTSGQTAHPPRLGTSLGAPAARTVSGSLREGVVAWHYLVIAVVLVILLVPARRFTLPAALPFEMEPYRLLVAVILLAWGASLLVDGRVRLRSTAFDGPLLAFAALAVVSLFMNHTRASSVAPVLSKKLVLFASVLLLAYMIASVVTRLDLATAVVKTLVVGGAIVSVGAIIEARTGTNVFDHADRAIPFFDFHDVYGANVATDSRGGRIRALASSQHPIELAAVLVLLMPLAFSLAYATGRRRWWFALALMAPATLGALSRTSVPMIFAVIGVALWVRRKEVVRLWPALVPLVVLIHFAVPGTIGGLADAFFPEGGLVAQQSDASVGSGRIATLGPVLHDELAANPVFGEGFSTRVTTGDDPTVPQNAPILDNQWLGILLETGVLGFVCLLWFFVRFIRRCGGAAKADRTLRGWLLAGVTASVAAAAVGMITFDAFSFTQFTFVLFILVGLGGSLLNLPAEEMSDQGETQVPALST